MTHELFMSIRISLSVDPWGVYMWKIPELDQPWDTDNVSGG